MSGNNDDCNIGRMNRALHFSRRRAELRDLLNAGYLNQRQLQRLFRLISDFIFMRQMMARYERDHQDGPCNDAACFCRRQ